MSALFVTDPLAGLDAEIDSSIGLMAASQEIGKSVWVCTPEGLAVIDGRLVARATRITLRPRSRQGDHRWVVEPEWFDVEERRIVDVAGEVSVALMRLDPPVTSRYQNTLHLLDVASAAGVLVANRPDGILQIQEKMFALRFPELIPPTVVTACQRVVEQFVSEHQVAVVKPVDGFAGTDVWMLRDDDPNAASLIESATQGGRRHVIVQRYLPRSSRETSGSSSSTARSSARSCAAPHVRTSGSGRRLHPPRSTLATKRSWRLSPPLSSRQA